MELILRFCCCCQVSFIFCQKDKESFYVSPPIERADLFFAVYFVLLLRYPILIPSMGSEKLKNFLTNFHKNLNPSFETPIRTRNKAQMQTGFVSCGRQLNRKMEQNLALYNLSLYDIFNYWLNDSKTIYREDVSVVKFRHDNQWFAIKCCELYKSSEEAKSELTNEMIVHSKIASLISSRKGSHTSRLKEKIRLFFIGCLFHFTLFFLVAKDKQFVPKFVFAGVIMIFHMLVTEYIEGKCYFGFDCMSTQERQACHASLRQLHALKILHGDVRGPNFIIKNPKTSSNIRIFGKKIEHSQNREILNLLKQNKTDPIAVLIDFGRAKVNATKKELELEMRQFNYEAFESISHPRRR